MICHSNQLLIIVHKDEDHKDQNEAGFLRDGIARESVGSCQDRRLS